MKRKEGRKLKCLISLYLNYAVKKSTIIIFSISFILMIVALIIISNPYLDMDSYLLSSKDFHKLYFTEGILILNIFNGIFVATLTILFSIHAISFDSLFLSHTKREIIVLAKIFASMILFLMLAILEFILLYGIPLIFYSEYKMDNRGLLTILYLFISMVFDYAISLALTILVPTIFSSMSILFIQIAKNMLISSFSMFKELIKGVLPVLLYKDSYLVMDSIFITPIFAILFFFIYFSIYNLKDIKIS